MDSSQHIVLAPAREGVLPPTRLALLALGLLAFATWLLRHPYHGIVHDSTLYTLLALARLHPDSLANDLFVRFGIQDHYTIFSPVYAGAIELFGIDRAAQLLTFLTHVGFFAAAWILARRWMSSSLALLAVGLLAALPSTYGSGAIFGVTEEFLTPRQPAESFVLLALAAALDRRFLLTAAGLLVATLLHPIIAAAGIALVVCLVAGLRQPRLAAGLALAVALAFSVLALFLSSGSLARFDPTWLSMLQSRLAYLFPSRWVLADWSNACVPLATLSVGAISAKQGVARPLCLAGLTSAGLGIALAIVGGDLLHIVIVTQLQVWRWLWLTHVLAVLVFPVIAATCWRAGHLGRAAVLLLIGAWINTGESWSLVLAAGACLGAACTSTLTDARYGRLILAGACMLLALSAIVFAGTIHTTLRQFDLIGIDHDVYDSPLLISLRGLQAWAYAGVLPACVLALAWRLGERADVRANTCLAIAAAAVCAAIVPLGWKTWTHLEYPPERYTAFASWRKELPTSAEVLWPDAPVGVWYVLERPSYWSLHQMAGAVFSRAATIYTMQREAAVAPVLPALRRVGPQSPASGPSLAAITASAVCKLPDLEFFASWTDLGPTPFAPVAPYSNHPNERLRLYRCANVRRSDTP